MLTLDFRFRMMSEERRAAISAKNAPNVHKLPRDLHDLTGETPYSIEDVVPGKVWSVTYTLDSGMLSRDPKLMDLRKKMGWDLTSETFRKQVLEGASSHGPQYVDIAKKDLDGLVEFYNKTKFTLSEERLAFNKELRMMVARLTGGALLLYCPVRIREEHAFKAWLDKLGRVEWIIVGSSAHTNYLPGAMTLYPDAKLVGSPAAADKLNVIHALPRGLTKFDFNCQDPGQLNSANRELEEAGVRLVYVEGDVATNALVAVAHGVLLSVDLIYGRHDGVGAMSLTRTGGISCQTLEEISWSRP